MRISILPALLMTLLLTGCGPLHMLGGRHIALQRTGEIRGLSTEKVEGKSCRTFVLFVPIGTATYGAAFEDALRQSPPGTTGLVEMELSVDRPIGLFFPLNLLLAQYCAYATGYPAVRSPGESAGSEAVRPAAPSNESEESGGAPTDTASTPEG